MSTMGAADSAARSSMVGSDCPAETSLMMWAPAARDSRAGGGELTDDGHDAAQLFVLIDADGPRPRRLASDIDDVGAGVDEFEAVGDGPVMVEIASAVGEGVGRDVEDAHDLRLLAHRWSVGHWHSPPEDQAHRLGAGGAFAQLPAHGGGGRRGPGLAEPGHGQAQVFGLDDDDDSLGVEMLDDRV